VIDKILSIFKLTQPKPIQRVEWVNGEDVRDGFFEKYGF